QNEGKFDDVPKGEDAKLSYWQWFWKKAWKNPENTIAKNHKHYVKIIWANMKSAFTNTLLLQLLTLGRLDIDSYIAGYVISFLVPFTAFSWKFEQGFELSSAYYMKYIPEELRDNPKAVQWNNNKMTK